MPEFTIKTNSIPSAPLRAVAKSFPVANLLFGVFFACTLVIPTAPLNKLLFVLLIIWSFVNYINRSVSLRFPSIAPMVIMGIFAYGFVVAQFNHVDEKAAVQFLLATLILPLIYFISAFQINMDRMAVIGSYLLVICTAIFWISSFLLDLPFLQTLSEFFTFYNAGSTSERDFFEGGATLTYQLSTVPFLFVGFCVLGMRLISKVNCIHDWVGQLLIIAAILLSGQRALIFITLIYTVYLLVSVASARYRWLVLTALALIMYSLWTFFIAGSNAVSVDEVSNQVKLGHFQSYLNGLSGVQILFGNGLASYYYSSGSDVMKSFTELTPIDFFRYFGIPLTFVLYFYLLFPLKSLSSLKRNNYGYTIAFLLYIIMSLTNPVMFNSFGLLVVLWYWQSLVCPDSCAKYRLML